MSECNRQPWLRAIAVVAALVIESPIAFAQVPNRLSPETPAAATQSLTIVNGPNFQPTEEQLGDALMSHQRYQAAIEAYKKAPTPSADLWNKLGIAYQMMLNPAEATRCYQMSLKLNPKNAHVLNNLGTVYDSTKQYTAAERLYKRALKLEPQSALIHKNLGTNLLAQHKYKQGWELYKAALAMDPQIFEARGSPRVDNPATAQERGAMNFYMAKGCVRAGMNDRAIEYLRMALNEGYTNPKKIEADSEFAGLHGIPAFEQLLAAQVSR